MGTPGLGTLGGGMLGTPPRDGTPAGMGSPGVPRQQNGWGPPGLGLPGMGTLGGKGLGTPSDETLKNWGSCGWGPLRTEGLETPPREGGMGLPQLALPAPTGVQSWEGVSTAQDPQETER